jgi:heme exporter protein A
VEYQQGSLTWFKDDGEPVDQDVDPSSLFHYVGHLDVVKPAFTVEENLRFWANLYGVPKDVDVALERMELEYLKDVPGAYLSAGQKRRAALARLLIGKRPLWIMDEPTVSLDVEGVAMVVALMKEHCAEGGMLMVTTHVEIGLDEVARLDLPRLDGV